MRLTLSQQFGRRRERVRNARREPRIGHLAVGDDLAVADREIETGRERFAPRIPCGEAQRVAVKCKGLVDMEDDVRSRVEGNPRRTGERKVALGMDARRVRGERRRIDRVGRVTAKPGQDRAIGALVASRARDRSVQVDVDAAGLVEQAVGLELVNEAAGGAHRAHGMGRRRPESDAKKIERADEHLRLPHGHARLRLKTLCYVSCRARNSLASHAVSTQEPRVGGRPGRSVTGSRRTAVVVASLLGTSALAGTTVNAFRGRRRVGRAMHVRIARCRDTTAPRPAGRSRSRAASPATIEVRGDRRGNSGSTRAFSGR